MPGALLSAINGCIIMDLRNATPTPTTFFALPVSASRRLAETIEMNLRYHCCLPYQILSPPFTGSFDCKTVLIIEKSMLIC